LTNIIKFIDVYHFYATVFVVKIVPVSPAKEQTNKKIRVPVLVFLFFNFVFNRQMDLIS